MELLQPDDWSEALELKAANPTALPIWGGTDVMVDLNFGRARPEAILDLTRVRALAEWDERDGALRIGSGVSYTTAIADLGDRLPGLAAASRTVGSPQIRNRGTIGGNLGSSSPAGDALPPLYASEAAVELASTRGTRRIPVADFITGPKRNVLEPDELIAAVHVAPAKGAQQFSKIGTRNAMVIAVCSFALELDPERRRVGTCIGSAAPTPMSSWKNDDAFWMSAPRPCCAAISSDATSVAQATPSATRSAVSMCGIVSGTMTLRKISGRWRRACARREHRSG